MSTELVMYEGVPARGRTKETIMDTTTLLIILIALVVLGGGGYYGRGRWY